MRFFCNPFKYKECYECDGKGYHEYLDCSKLASECCGGCYREVWCEKCNATGKLIDEDYGFFNIKQRWYRKSFNKNYWRVLCNMSIAKFINLHENR